MNGDWIVEFENEGVRLVVEDDGEVGYAYLFVEGKPSGLVWLYNRAPGPSDGPVWKEQRAQAQEKSPLNAVEYILPTPFDPPGEDDIAALFNKDTKGAAIYVRGRLHATLAPGAYPGKCCLAAQDGPLAKAFTG